jgi:hypothetical protein
LIKVAKVNKELAFTPKDEDCSQGSFPFGVGRCKIIPIPGISRLVYKILSGFQASCTNKSEVIASHLKFLFIR